MKRDAFSFGENEIHQAGLTFPLDANELHETSQKQAFCIANFALIIADQLHCDTAVRTKAVRP